MTRNQQSHDYFAHPVETEDHLGQAKRLHAEVYVSRGFVPPEDISKDGTLKRLADPHQHHARYFAVIPGKSDSGEIVAAARQIELDPKKGFDSFPIMRLAHIYPSERAKILRCKPGDFVEISALVKKRGMSSLIPLFLYRAMWHHSLRHEHRYWLMACDVRLYERLKLLFGGAITQIGDVTPYYGGNIVPAKLNLKRSVPAIIKEIQVGSVVNRRIRKSTLQFVLQGLTRDDMTKQQWTDFISRELIEG